MTHEESIKNVILFSNFNKERMFPILNKLDRIWNENEQLQFCEVVNLLKLNENKTDLDLTKSLDKFIDENNIK